MHAWTNSKQMTRTRPAMEICPEPHIKIETPPIKDSKDMPDEWNCSMDPWWRQFRGPGGSTGIWLWNCVVERVSGGNDESFHGEITAIFSSSQVAHYKFAQVLHHEHRFSQRPVACVEWNWRAPGIEILWPTSLLLRGNAYSSLSVELIVRSFVHSKSACSFPMQMLKRSSRSGLTGIDILPE